MTTVHIKVIPSAKRNRIAGRYGDAIKVQVSAPPEDGKANRAVVELIASLLDLRVKQVSIIRGHSQPRKVLQIDGLDPATVEARLLRVD